MTGWVLVVSLSALIQFPDDSTIRETTTLESRMFDSEETCNRTGEMTKFNMFAKHHNKAASLSAKVLELDLEHHCIHESKSS